MGTPDSPLRVQLFGAEAAALVPLLENYPQLEQVEDNPDIVVCYGGDGTLLAGELRYPGIPKVPILNSQRGHRCIPHPKEQVIQGLAEGTLTKNTYMKLHGAVTREGDGAASFQAAALNEFAVHMGRINSAVRFKLWLDGEPYDRGVEILGDGFVICTPFGSTAYFNQITRGYFTRGMGIAFKATSEHTDHLVLPPKTEMRVLITRGPAVLAFDSSLEYHTLEEGNELVVRQHEAGATILTCDPVKRLDEPF